MNFLARILVYGLYGAMAAGVAAQSPETFEVAAIKPDDPMNPGTSYRFEPGGSIRIDGATLQNLVQFAYDLRDFQLTGAKGWMTTEKFAIHAKGTIAEGPADFRNMNDQQRRDVGILIRKRMQALLAERFQLAVHRETKEMPVYALVVAKGGSKLKPNESPDGSNQSMTANRTMLKATRATVERIANALAGMTGRPVRDETGLKGYYDFELKWTQDVGPPGPGAGGSEERPAAEATGPTLFTAVQEQLGLKLESRKGPVEIVAIDRAERPSEN